MRGFLNLGLLFATILNVACSNTKFAASQSTSASSTSSSVSPSASSPSTSSSSGVLISAVQPVLAVRGAACLVCHAQIQSNIITDFGAGDPFYLGAGAGYDASAYGNGRGGWSQAQSIVGTVFVPNVSAGAQGESSLADLVSSLVGRALRGKVQAASSVYIGAPTAAQIERQAGANLSLTSYVYVPTTGSTVSFSGLQSSDGVWSNSGILNCDGDLVVEGPLSLHGLSIKTSTGCRIYATGTIFLDGAIVFSGSSSTQNLQLLSSRAVMIGFCNSSSAVGTRLSGIQSYAQLRSPREISAEISAIESETDLVSSSSLGATQCQPDDEATENAAGTDPSFSKLLVNAPIVQSLYATDFQGVVIAEAAMFHFGDFHFAYDPVFSSVPILPLTGLGLSLQMTE